MNPHYKGRPFATHAVSTLPYQTETIKSHEANWKPISTYATNNLPTNVSDGATKVHSR